MKLRVNVNGVNYDVDVEILDEGGAAPPVAAPRPAAPIASTASVAAARPVAAPVAQVAAPAAAPPVAAGANVLTSPIPGTVLEITAQPGQAVKHGDVVMMLDAMKMNAPIHSARDGKIKAILAQVGDAVKMGQPLIEFE
jgi:glutaconyl-CoA decarboxylase